MIVVLFILITSGLGAIAEGILVWQGIRSLRAASASPLLHTVALGNLLRAGVLLTALALNAWMCALLLPVLQYLKLTGTLGTVLEVVLCFGPFAILCSGLIALWTRRRLVRNMQGESS